MVAGATAIGSTARLGGLNDWSVRSERSFGVGGPKYDGTKTGT